MLRKMFASVLSDPFRGDRPVWLALLGTIPGMGVAAVYEYATREINPVLVIDSLIAMLAAGLLVSMVIVAGAAGVAWSIRRAKLVKASLAGDALDETPEAELGVAA